MKKRIEIGVIGSAVFAPRNPERTSLEEAMHAVTKSALRVRSGLYNTQLVVPMRASTALTVAPPR